MTQSLQDDFKQPTYNKLFWLMLVALLFSIGIRLIWVSQIKEIEQFHFNNQPLIGASDGYHFAAQAKRLLNKETEHDLKSDEEDIDSISGGIAWLTAFLSQTLPFSFENIIFYMPVFFASLIVIPIILIGQSTHLTTMGFIAALFACISWSYYNRTMAGNYDTDLLNIVLPCFFLWALINVITTQQPKYLIYAVIFMLLYRWWYPQSYSLLLTYCGVIFLIVGYKTFQKQDNSNDIWLLIFMLVSIQTFDFLIKITLLTLLLFIHKNHLVNRYRYYCLALSLVIFLMLDGINPVWQSLNSYLAAPPTAIISNNLPLHFVNVMQTIQDTRLISIEMLARRISGHSFIFLVSICGYFWLTVKKPVMLLGLPMLGLGLAAYWLGLRFTIYAVPILALGIAFFISRITLLVSSHLQYRYQRFSQLSLLSVLSLTVLFPNIKHAIDYKVSPVLTQSEVKVLNHLNSVSSDNDYVFSWWDYGYPIHYFTQAKILSDGQKHNGSVNFSSSFILTQPPQSAAKMLKLEVNYNEIPNNRISRRSNIARMMEDYQFKDSNQFLFHLNNEITLPAVNQEIFLYLPLKMLSIYPAINRFSNLDLMTGKQNKPILFFLSKNFQESSNTVSLGNDIFIHKQSGMVQINNQQKPIKRLTTTYYNKQQKLIVNTKQLNPLAQINVIYMSNYKQFIIVDDQTYQSLYFQLFILENYDHRIFEPVVLTPLAKVYKLRI